MSATVAAALKKIAVAVLTDKKLRRTVLGIILGVIIIIIMPVAAVISLFNGDIEIDTDRLQTLVVENLSAEEKAKLQAVEDTMYAIEDEMKAAGFTAEKAKEAQVLYVLALSDYAEQTDFVSKLAGCFAEDQTDEQLITAVNTAFGTTLNAEDFTKVMTAIRAKAINTSGFTDPDTKNAHDLVEWAKQAHAKKWGYVWGTYGEVLTESMLNGKVSQYPDEVGGKEEYIRTHWLGGRTADCIGLIKGYGWYDCESGSITYGTNGKVLFVLRRLVPDVADQRGVIEPFRLYPKIFTRLVALAFGVHNQGIYQLQNILFRADIRKRVVFHGFFEIDEVQALDTVMLPFKQPSDFVQDRSFRVGHDIGGMALQKGRFCEKSCFAAARTADDKNVFVCLCEIPPFPHLLPLVLKSVVFGGFTARSRLLSSAWENTHNRRETASTEKKTAFFQPELRHFRA